MQLPDLARLLAESTNAYFDITLIDVSGALKVDYEISVELPSDQHVQLVERAFARLSASGNLSLHGINGFIREVAAVSTARRYTDGLSGYLFGVLAKDQRGETTLTQEQGRTKLNEAHQTLTLIDRPLAKVVRAVIEFQANSFARTRGVRVAPRLLHAMRWFESARAGGLDLLAHEPVLDGTASARVPSTPRPMSCSPG